MQTCCQCGILLPMEGSGSGAPAPSLRDRKRERTRRALVDAAAALFERKGYDETTVAEIAAAADIGTRTFFSYFPTKEELLFPESDARVRAAVDAIATRDQHERPAEVLLRALRLIGEDSDEMASRLAMRHSSRRRWGAPKFRRPGVKLQFGEAGRDRRRDRSTAIAHKARRNRRREGSRPPFFRFRSRRIRNAAQPAASPSMALQTASA